MALPPIRLGETVLSGNGKARLSRYKGYRAYRYEVIAKTGKLSTDHPRYRGVPFRDLNEDTLQQAIRVLIGEGADPSDFEGIAIP